jgi:hypothetical protein
VSRLLLRGVGAEHRREVGVEVDPGVELVGLGLAELRRLANGLVRVRDREQVREPRAFADLEDRVIEGAEGVRVGEGRRRRALLRLDPVDDRLGGGEVVVAELLDPRDGHPLRHRIELTDRTGGGPRGGWRRRRRLGDRRLGLGRGGSAGGEGEEREHGDEAAFHRFRRYTTRPARAHSPSRKA